MSDLNEVIAGSFIAVATILLEQEPIFYTTYKVVRTTNTLAICEHDVRFRLDDGYMLNSDPTRKYGRVLTASMLAINEKYEAEKQARIKANAPSPQQIQIDEARNRIVGAIEFGDLNLSQLTFLEGILIGMGALDEDDESQEELLEK